MKFIIQWLNENQGLIGWMSIIVAIIGFFIANKKINTISQKSKNGDNSTTLQIGNINKHKND